MRAFIKKIAVDPAMKILVWTLPLIGLQCSFPCLKIELMGVLTLSFYIPKNFWLSGNVVAVLLQFAHLCCYLHRLIESTQKNSWRQT